MKKTFFLKFIILICIVLISASCGKSKNSSYTAPAPPPNNSPEVSMYNMAFSPASLTVAKGTTVKWTNNDSYPHTVTSNDGTTFNSNSIAAAGTFSYTANVAGTFNYHCTIHGTAMSGTLIVTP